MPYTRETKGKIDGETEGKAPAGAIKHVVVRFLGNYDDTPTYYINHAEIAVGKHEFALAFAKLPTKPSRSDMEHAKATQELAWETDIQVLVPPTLIVGLIRALETARDGYQNLFGPLPEDEKETK